MVDQLNNKQPHPSPPPSIQMNEIVHLLEQGVEFMWEKEYNKACLSLTKALQMNKAKLLSQVAHDHQDFQQSDHAKSSFDDEDSLSSSLHSCQELLTTITARSSSSSSSRSIVSMINVREKRVATIDDCCWPVNGRNFYIHSTPLSITLCDLKSDLFRRAPSRELGTALSVITIFNLALSHHLLALDQGRRTSCAALSKSKDLLNRALALYGHAKVLLYQLNLESCWLLSLAILNNEAQILLMVGENEEADSIIQGILSGLCCLNWHYRDGTEHHLPPVSTLEGFSHNTSHLILKETFTAKAA